MALKTKNKNFQNVQSSALPVVGSAADATQEAINAQVDRHLDSPLRLYVDSASPGVLKIGSSKVDMGDGAYKSLPPIDDVQNLLASAQISFTANTATNVLLKGATFAMPTATGAGKYVRLVIAYNGSSNKIDVNFSGESATQAALTNAGTLFAALDQLPIGYIDLVSLSTTEWKSASSSAVTPEVLMSDIIRYGAGSGVGSGGGGDKAFKLQNVSGTAGTLKGGYLLLDNGTLLATGSGTSTTTVGKDLTLNLSTILTASSLTFTAATVYQLVIDLLSLSAPVTLTDTGRKLYNITSSNLKFFGAGSAPDTIDPRRYIWLGEVKTAVGATDFTSAVVGTRPGKLHGLLNSYAPPQTYSTQISSSSSPFTHTLSHGFYGKPQSVQLFYFDGTKTIGLDASSHLINVTATTIVISAAGLTLSGTQYIEVCATYFPTQASYAGHSRTFTSDWYQNTATTQVAHLLESVSDIRGYEVQEWNVTTGLFRNIERSSLVKNFDGTNFYLDWTSLTPSSILQYRVVAGGSPLPWSIPQGFDTITNRAGTGAPNFSMGATGTTAGFDSITNKAGTGAPNFPNGATGGVFAPIGTIVAYHPGYYTSSGAGFTLVGPSANTVAAVNAYLPSNWRVCNGAALNDAASPIFNGANRFLPLLTDDRFLKGSTAAGVSGGANSISLSTNELPLHTHTISHDHASQTSLANSVGHTHPMNHDHAAQNTLSESVGHVHFSPGGVGANSIASFSGTSVPITLAAGSDIGLRYGASGQAGLQSGGNNVNHQHSLDLPNFVGSTDFNSVGHNHDVDLPNFTGSSGPSGSGSAFSILPNYLNAFYIMRVK